MKKDNVFKIHANKKLNFLEFGSQFEAISIFVLDPFSCFLGCLLIAIYAPGVPGIFKGNTEQRTEFIVQLNAR